MYNGFLSLKDNLFNLGFWIFLVLIILNIIFLILLCCFGIKEIEIYMKKQLAKYGYIGESDEGIAFCHNYVKKIEKIIAKLNQIKNRLNKEKYEPPKHKKIQRSPNDQLVINKNKNKKGKIIKSDSRFLMRKKKKVQILNNEIENKLSLYNNALDGKIVNFGRNKGDNPSKCRLNTSSNIKIKNEEINKEDSFHLNLININVKQLKKNNYIPNESEHILNIYEFEEAKKYDKKGICSIYFIFLFSKQVIMHAFLYKSKMEPLPLRLSLLKFMLGCDLAFNAIFYTDNKISEKKYN